MIARWISHAGVAFMRLLSRAPLGWIRALGWLLGRLLYAVLWPRRRVVDVNMALCFAHLSPGQRRQMARQVFVCVASAWLDRSWLWHGPEQVVRQRLQMVGDLGQLQGNRPTVVFAPHFVGLDAGWTALTQQLARPLTTIYTNQADPVIDAWILEGRRRFGSAHLFGRADGVREIVGRLRDGALLYLLPDMNFGPEESVFVPFFGVPAATVPSLSRFARLAQAQVVPVVTRLTATGYEIEVLPAWADFPTSQALDDTARMNHELEAYILAMPEQYYWVHKRFKSRPAGEASVY